MFKKSLMLFGTNILNRGFNFLFRVLLKNILSTTEFGILAVILPVQSLILMLTSYGITPSISKFVSEYKAKKENYVKSSFGFVFIGLILFIFLFLLSSPFSSFFGKEFSNYETYFRIAVIIIPFGMIFSIFTGIFMGIGKVKTVSILLVIMEVSSLIFGISMAFYKFSFIFLAFGFGYAVSTIVGIYFYKKFNVDGEFVFSEFRKIFKFSLPISATAIGLVFLFNTDILILGHYFTPMETAVYGMVMPTARLVPAFSIALASVVLPEISEKMALKKKIDEKVTSSFSLTFYMSVPAAVLVFAFSKEILYVITGEILGYNALKILSLGMIAYSIYYTSNSIFQGTSRPQTPAKIIGYTVFLNIFLNFLLIPKYSIFGAGLATSLSCIFAASCSLVLLRPRLSFDLKYFIILLPLFVFEYFVGVHGRFLTLLIYGAFGGSILLGYFYMIRNELLRK
ncbi:MAG: flippase [Methanomicrobia archaeon]|nr:flippase [Methanomicrobia archaeon]